MKTDSAIHNHQRAHQQLRYFSENSIQKYSQQRNFDYGNDHKNCVSGLSMAINRRIISEWYVIKHILKVHPYEKVEKFVQEVCWRTYWKGYLEHHPSIWNDYIDNIKNLEFLKLNQSYRNAIKGETGIECFDFWMLTLIEKGYLHNHARMWFSSIWIHTLKLPWQLGANIFLENLIDGDPASNTLSWRWVAGLHTKGKCYLANAENIKKFTGGQFYPVNQLSKYPHLTEESEHSPPQELKLKDSKSKGIKCFLVHESDLSIGRIPKSDVLLVQKSPLKSVKRSRLVENFIANALKSFQDDFTNKHETELILIDLEDDKMIKETLKRKGINSVHTYYPSIGFINDQLKKIESKGYKLEFMHTGWDKTFWPHASKGFFKLESKIPRLLRQLDCM